MLARGTAIHKSFLVPLFALQAPATIVSWMKGEYGIWAAFLALLVRLFFYIPGELELPFITLLLVIVSPYQIMRLRGTQEGVVFSLIIAAYLAFQHFTRAGQLEKSFRPRVQLLPTLATICIVCCAVFASVLIMAHCKRFMQFINLCALVVISIFLFCLVTELHLTLYSITLKSPERILAN
ncbi:cold-regulated 413 inner membrane protein 2 chloroplastic [Phtheirospermum japonicum]|uniref:Cold-regulated 413 inner membrane protein 2 chloroplastic n=1 Tax=Phtheirospermum japonicum TaxID=374723 RepID=A0A830C576_9LAMI|nr:cold-regulated 413 inner membrane protein 2 chloroplastic [Phtheirospermum japonicum]